MAKLTIIASSNIGDVGQSYTIEQECTIGHEPTNNIVFDSPELSRSMYVFS